MAQRQRMPFVLAWCYWTGMIFYGATIGELCSRLITKILVGLVGLAPLADHRVSNGSFYHTRHRLHQRGKPVSDRGSA